MSSSFSMANQKLKEFFGASQTKDFGLQNEKDSHQIGSTKLNNFVKALRQYYEVILMWPEALERLYATFGELAPKEIYYDGAEYQNNYYGIIEIAKVKASNLYERYSYIYRQLTIEEDAIKKCEKEFENARQRYDHYRHKIERLTKEFSTMENPRGYKSAKDQLDRNIVKLTNAEVEYNKELMRLRSKLHDYHTSFADQAFGCFELHSDDLSEFIIKAAPFATAMKKFVASKRARGKPVAPSSLIPIEHLFDPHRIDYFSSFENQFMNPKLSEGSVTLANTRTKSTSLSKPPLPQPHPPTPDKPIDNPTHKSIDKDQFNFFADWKTNPSSQAGSTITTELGQNTDLLGIT